MRGASSCSEWLAEDLNVGLLYARIDMLVLFAIRTSREPIARPELLFPALPGWSKPDPLHVPGLRAFAAFTDPGRPAVSSR
jgi:hypothetical protein